MNPPSHPIVLCVDDFALHPLIDQAVLQLASKGRISATSCMSTAPRWRTAAHDLKPLRPHLAVGLHFNLTESHGGLYRALTLKQAIAQAYLGRWQAAQWQAVWREQLDAFEAAMGTAPDFIDGHQHVHQLPGVRQALLAEITARYAAHERPWLRSTVPAGRLWSSSKALIIATLGGYSATRLWRTAHLATNHGFAGVYGFDAPTPAPTARACNRGCARCNRAACSCATPPQGWCKAMPLAPSGPRSVRICSAMSLWRIYSALGGIFTKGGACLKTMARQKVANSIDA